MSRRTQNTRLPDAPPTWDTSSRDTWNSLMRALETSNLFDAGRRTLPEFHVAGSVSAAVTLNVEDGSLQQLRHIVGRMLIALDDTQYLETIQLSALTSSSPSDECGTCLPLGITVASYGAVGDGVTDDAPAFAAAFAALGTGGGEVYVPRGKQYLIDTSLTVPSNVKLVGAQAYNGSPGDNFDAPYETIRSSLIINSAITISLESNSGVRNLFIYRKGTTFPVLNASAFAGNALTIVGDDVHVAGCQLLGFDKCIVGAGIQRPRVYDCWIDGNNGVEIANSLDVPRIERVHCWPFATIEAVANSLATGADLTRPGTGIYLIGPIDWAVVHNCFTYGYLTGFRTLNNVNSSKFVNCGADNISPTLYTGSIGFNIGGLENQLIGCNAAAQQSAGIGIATGDGNHITLDNCTVWACGDHGVLIQGGDVTLSNVLVRNSGTGITVNNANSRVIDAGGLRFDACTTPWNNIIASTRQRIRWPINTNETQTLVGGIMPGLPTVASADPFTLPGNSDVFRVTGTTNFGTIHGPVWPGRTVTLVFAGVLTVFTGGSAILDGNFVSSAGATLTLIYDGTSSVWRELSRTPYPLFTSTQRGAVSPSGGGTTNFLRADGAWAVPPGTGGGGGPAAVGSGSVNISGTTLVDVLSTTLSLNVGDTVFLEMSGFVFNNTSAAQTIHLAASIGNLTLSLSGSATIADLGIAAVSFRATLARITSTYTVISGQSAQNPASTDGAPVTGVYRMGHASSSVLDLSGPQTVRLRARGSTSSSTLTFNFSGAKIEKFTP